MDCAVVQDECTLMATMHATPSEALADSRYKRRLRFTGQAT
jgi:hypothetical protein